MSETLLLTQLKVYSSNLCHWCGAHQRRTFLHSVSLCRDSCTEQDFYFKLKHNSPFSWTKIKVSGSIQWNVLKHSELTIMHQIFCLSKVTRWNIDRFIIKQTCTSILFIYTLPRYRHHLNHCWIVDGLARRGLPHPTTFAHCWRKIWSHTRMC